MHHNWCRFEMDKDLFQDSEKRVACFSSLLTLLKVLVNDDVSKRLLSPRTTAQHVITAKREDPHMIDV